MVIAYIRPDKNFLAAHEQLQHVNSYAIANNITAGTYSISGLANVRDIVKWGFNEDTKLHSSSEVYQLNDKYVIAVLVRKNLDKYLTLDKVVIQQKKVDKIYNDYFANAGKISDLDAFAQKIKSTKISVPNVTFAAFQVSNFGYDPKFLAAMTMLKENEISKPIKGDNGVYVMKINKIIPATKMQNVSSYQKSLTSTLRNRANYQVIPALKSAYGVEDFRDKFF